MDNKDGQKNGKDFWSVVQDAVNSGNFQQLNEQVRETIDDTVDGIRSGVREAGNGIREGMRGAESGIREGMRGAGNEWRRAWNESGSGYQNRYQKKRQPGYQAGTRKMNQSGPQLPAVYAKNPPGQIYGTVMAITGYSLTSVFALSTIVCGVWLMFQPTIFAGITAGVMGLFTFSSLILGIAGSVARGRAKRFRNYVKQIGGRAYCTIDELSTKCGRKKKAVLKDLKKMIEKRMFLQGHLDAQETCVIVTDAMYQQYLTVQQQAKEREEQQKLMEERKSQLPEDCQQILDEGREYIQYIKECNADIPGEEISQKLTRLEQIITRIFDEVGKNPSLAGDLRKFMNYYLPTTRKLVDAYREMDKETIASEHIQKTKKEIEDTMDTINQAFENLINSFFEETAWDISSDISVLHTMLAQEGLTKKDFE
ncbi:MAG: hypothetical protein EOM18_07425 [Clostridia bacterium]|nr:hypothetical protein [Clostridia bacterium]